MLFSGEIYTTGKNLTLPPAVTAGPKSPLFVCVAPYLIIRSITSKDVDAMDTMDQTKEEGQADMGG